MRRAITIVSCQAVAVAFLALGATGAPPAPETREAKPYVVVGARDEEPSNGRTARHWFLLSESSTFEEHAQTVVQAALDLHREFGLDLTTVTIYPNRALVGSPTRLATGFYAADGRAGQGLPGADPTHKAMWSVLATHDTLSAIDLAIAELWYELAPEHPSKDPLSSLAVDPRALRDRISSELGIGPDRVRNPSPALDRWSTTAE